MNQVETPAGSLPVRDPMLVRTGISAGAVLLLTSIHHAYGALIYDAAFRSHVTLGAIPLALLITGLLYLGGKEHGSTLARAAIGLAAFLIATLLGLGIGVFEGGYNHLLKNVLYFSGTSHEVMQRLFPAPMYEMPSDAFFEITGVLQLLAGLIAGRDAIRLVLARFA